MKNYNQVRFSYIIEIMAAKLGILPEYQLFNEDQNINDKKMKKVMVIM